MNPSLLISLGFCIGAAMALLILAPSLRAAYRAGMGSATSELQQEVIEAFQRGKAAGWAEMSNALIRDMGPKAVRDLSDRIAAMDKVESITGGKRT